MTIEKNVELSAQKIQPDVPANPATHPNVTPTRAPIRVEYRADASDEVPPNPEPAPEPEPKRTPQTTPKAQRATNGVDHPETPREEPVSEDVGPKAPEPSHPKMPGTSVPLTKANVGFLYVDPGALPELPEPVITIVKCMKPPTNTAIRVYPDPTVSRVLMLMEAEREFWAVPLPIFNQLRLTTIPDLDKHVRCTLLRPYMTSKSSMTYLWPLKRDNAIEVGENGYNRTADNLATQAESRWLRISSNRDLSIYQGFPPSDDLPEPKWPPDIDIDDLIVRAFGNRIVDKIDHPIFKGLHTKGTM